MAIDDVISDFDNQISSGARLDLQPLSGDEWLVTMFLMEGVGWDINPHTDTGTISVGVYGGATSTSSVLEVFGFRTTNMLVTNSEYVRMFNQTGGTVNGGYSAIKTKD